MKIKPRLSNCVEKKNYLYLLVKEFSVFTVSPFLSLNDESFLFFFSPRVIFLDLRRIFLEMHRGARIGLCYVIQLHFYGRCRDIPALVAPRRSTFTRRTGVVATLLLLQHTHRAELKFIAPRRPGRGEVTKVTRNSLVSRQSLSKRR